MNTQRLYQQDVYLKECEATVLAVRGDRVILDRTIFFPTGGGQSCDLGFIGSQEVLEVSEADGAVCHQVRGADSLQEGDTVLCRIDWDRRFDNMQRHCGEHILSGVCYQLFGGINRGFHMGEDYMTVDISLEKDPSITKITWEMAKRAELAANEVIWSDAPVTVRRFQSRREAEQLPLRKALAIDEEISIVCVGDVNHAADCVACCGTHPSSAGQVGLVKLYKVEHYKGMFRIYFEAGKRALLDYDKKHDRIAELSAHFSAGVGDLMDKVLAQEQRAKAVKDELNALRRSITAARAEEIRGALCDGSEAPLLFQYEDMKTGDLMNLGKALIPGLKRLLLLLSPSEKTLLLFSGGSPDCGALVKARALSFGGKGGGGSTSARAVFSSREALEKFIESLCAQRSQSV